MKLGRFVQIAD